MIITIGKIGRIVAGEDVGHYVKVVDDTANTGGYLILTAAEPDFINGFDNWVENKEAVDAYFHEAKWLVDWI